IHERERGRAQARSCAADLADVGHRGEEVRLSQAGDPGGDLFARPVGLVAGCRDARLSGRVHSAAATSRAAAISGHWLSPIAARELWMSVLAVPSSPHSRVRAIDARKANSPDPCSLASSMAWRN